MRNRPIARAPASVLAQNAAGPVPFIIKHNSQIRVEKLMNIPTSLRYVSIAIFVIALTALIFQSLPGISAQTQTPMTVQRSADRMSAAATWTPNQGAEYQAFFVVAKLLPGESDPQGFGVKTDTFRWVDYPLAGNAGSLTITGLDSARDYIYGVTSIARNSDGSWGAWSAYQMVRNAAPAPSDTPTPSPTPSPTSTPVPETDRAPLAALHNATNGAGWTTRTNWLSDRPLGEWHGVTTDQSGRVTQISLPGNNLVGNISPQLGSLDNLETLDLSGNLLDGSIPSQLGRLSNLRTLDLSDNLLDGTIPSQLGSLSSLRTLDLSENQLTGAVPSQLGGLSSLEVLNLSENQLTGPLPQNLTRIPDLNRFDFSGNSSLCAPADTSFQTWFLLIANRSGLVCGQVSADKTVLTALYNSTDGTNWRNNTNWLTDEPLGDWHGVTTDQLGRVSRLNLDDNLLSGVIPTQLGSLNNLETLDLSDNRLRDAIPTELGSLNNLVTLDLSENRLNGAIPTELGNLNNLRTLNLSDNRLSGNVPSELSSLRNLRWLRLSSNQLTGELPSSFTAIANLDTFDFSGNSGLCAPADNSFQTWFLRIQNRSGLVCGQVEADKAALTALYNATDGPLWPAEARANWTSGRPLGEWKGVTTDQSGRVSRIILDGDYLNGSLPTQLGNLANLEVLKLSDSDLNDVNRLTGGIPPELGSLANLEILDLSGNSLSGGIPTQLGDLSNLEELNLSDTSLTGVIPSELGDLSNLETLDLSDRAQGGQLGGSIPAQLGSLSNLETLRLNGNDLSGAVPSELGDLTNLGILDISNNDLTGPLPQTLTKIADLKTFTFNANGTLDDGGLCALGVPEFKKWLDAIENPGNIDRQSCRQVDTDRAALTALYNATDGPNWSNNNNWLSDKPLGTWDGVSTSTTDDSLVQIDLSNEGLDGTLPTQLGGLVSLTSLDLSSNQLSGAIPSELGLLVELVTLDLSDNELSGAIPTQLSNGTAPLGSLSALATLDLSNNRLDGAIPTQLNTLPALVTLDLSENRLDGTIPTLPGTLTTLNLSVNSLIGSIPTTLSTPLAVLNLSGNRLIGGIQGLPTSLTDLNLSDNQLTGAIPPALGTDNTVLVTLNLSENQLSGSIPTELSNESGEGSLAALTHLHLNDNSLSGAIPTQLSSLTTLTHLYLSGNSGLTGCVPEALEDNIQNTDVGVAFCAAPGQ